MLTNRSLLLYTLVLSFCATASLGRAANIAWGAPQNITGDANVLNTGIQVAAFRLGNTGLTAATVNGVTFQPFALADGTASLTIGNYQLNFPGNGSLSNNIRFGTTATPYGNLPAATRNLLQSGSFNQTGGSTPITLTISGLTVNTAYTFQWWTNNAGSFTYASGQLTRATGGTGSVTLLNNNANNGNLGNVPGGIGQFAVGTFTADATTQTITFTAANDDLPTFNAFQLRVVPEPGTWTMLSIGAGLLGVVTLRQRRTCRD